jgi:hypothetical protein
MNQFLPLPSASSAPCTHAAANLRNGRGMLSAFGAKACWTRKKEVQDFLEDSHGRNAFDSHGTKMSMIKNQRHSDTIIATAQNLKACFVSTFKRIANYHIFALLAMAPIGCSQPPATRPVPAPAVSLSQPPIPMAAVQTTKPTLHPCTNCPPPLHYVVNGMVTLVCSTVKSPNVVGYQLWECTNLLNPSWFLAASSTNNVFTVSVTNYPFGFFTPAAVNSSGVRSKLL